MRKIKKNPYDKVAYYYDVEFMSDQYKKEEQALFKILGSLSGSVLDIGCGTGTLLDYYNIDDYLGIDPSEKMLEFLSYKHKNAKTEKLILSDYYGYPKDNVIALFSASYIEDLEHFNRVWNEKGKLFLVFYKQDYIPHTHKVFNIKPKTYKYSKQELQDFFDVEIIDFNNYLIVKNG